MRILSQLEYLAAINATYSLDRSHGHQGKVRSGHCKVTGSIPWFKLTDSTDLRNLSKRTGLVVALLTSAVLADLLDRSMWVMTAGPSCTRKQIISNVNRFRLKTQSQEANKARVDYQSVIESW